MTGEDEIAFADAAGRFYARHYSFPPVTGRVLGYLGICEPREQSLAELAETLRASRSAIAGAVKSLEAMGVVRRARAAGDRMDRVALDPVAALGRGFDPAEYRELGDLARQGLRVLEGASARRRAVLEETAALADFLLERIPALRKEWETHRDELRHSGALPPLEDR